MDADRPHESGDRVTIISRSPDGEEIHGGVAAVLQRIHLRLRELAEHPRGSTDLSAHDVDLEPARVSGEEWWRWHVATAALLPPLLYLLLRPESFSVIPNGLDPYFYTGYVLNFDDIMREVGDGYYFVSRWTSYMPARAFAAMFGPVAGRLVLRWAIASLMLLSLWHLGRRWQWNRSTAVVVGVVVLTCPIFVRAFMTDYVEWTVVSLGLISVCQCLEGTTRHWRSLAIGAIGAAVVIANPLALPVIVLPLVANAWLMEPRFCRRSLVHVSEIAAAAITVVIAGLLMFRVKYGLDNVYQPTIDFLSENPDYVDLLRSPRSSWLGAFTWLYVPALILVTMGIVAPLRRRIALDATLIAVFGVLGAQYVWHWLDQFARGGNGLEISYYWSFIFPALGVALAAVVGGVRWRPATATGFLGIGWLIVVVTRTTEIRLPGGWWLVPLALAAVSALFAVGAHRPQATVGALVLLTLTAQIAAPDYDPSSYHPFNMDPRYDGVYYADARGRQRLESTIWLADELDTLPSDAGMYFFGVDDASGIVGIYGAHVTNRWLPPQSNKRPAATDMSRIDSGTIPLLAIYGPPDVVGDVQRRVTRGGDIGTVLLRADHAAGLRYSLAVVQLPIPAYEPNTWPARSLPGETGTVELSGRTAKRASDGPGFIVSGPSVYLTRARYRVTVTYSSASDPAVVVGSLDVSQDGDVRATTDLVGTSGRATSTHLETNVVDGYGYDFRVFFADRGDLTVYSVTSEPIG